MHGNIGTMQIMDTSGHTTVTWDSSKLVEVDAARETFDTLTGQGYQAFEVEGTDGRGRRMTAFDPKADKVMMVPQLRGG